MMTFILVIHSITCVLLVLAILMQAGRGGGLTENFSSAESVFGAQTSVFMVRLTSVLAAVFFVTSLTLAFMSSRMERSLVAGQLKASDKKAVDITIPIPASDGLDLTVEPLDAQDLKDKLNLGVDVQNVIADENAESLQNAVMPETK